MAGDVLNFILLSLSSILIIVNPLAATLFFVSLTSGMGHQEKLQVARDACRYALLILVAFALLGTILLDLFGITIDAFRIGGGILLFGIGMEMVYARTSRTKMTATEKYESMDADDVSVMPMAIPMIAGPGAITTTIVLESEALGTVLQKAVILASIIIAIVVTYVMMTKSEQIVSRVGQKEFRVINRLMGMLLIAIAVQFVITGLRSAFPLLAGA
jgi:multiple antibiotic resistance protein